MMGLVIDKKLVKTVLLTVLVFGLLLFLNNICFASDGADLPWNKGLETLVKAFSGKTALFVACIGLFVLAGMAIFGGDLGVVGKGLMMVVIAGSILGGLIFVAETFIDTGFCI